jgi:hypothetical protein
MKIRVVGDHSELHGGCAAVFRVLTATLREVGTIADPAEDYDLLVVNGEGSMHHDSPACRDKLGQIEAAQEAGKATWLVNSVWQENGPACNALLGRLDCFWVRGPRSAADLAARHGMEVSWGLDLSYFDPLDGSAAPVDFGGETIATDFWNSDLRCFARPTAGAMARYPYLDMGSMGWSELVASIATAGMIVTGRHHAMYAACKARRPFIPIAGNTHKFEDLLRGAGSAIPVCSTWEQVRQASQWLSGRRDEFERLFDWMEKQRAWTVGAPAAHTGLGRPKPVQALSEARSRLVIGDGSGAVAILDAALAENSDSAPLKRLLRIALPKSGDIFRAALQTARDRLEHEQNVGLDREYHRMIHDNPDWDFATLWPRLNDSGAVSDPDALANRAAEIFARAKDDVEAEAIRGILLAQAVRRMDWSATECIERLAESRPRPAWLTRYDSLRLTVRRKRFETLHADAVAEDLWRPEYDEASRADHVEYLMMAGRADDALLERLVSLTSSEANDGQGLMSGLAVAVASLLGRDEHARHLAASLPRAARVAGRILAVASLLDDDGFERERAFHAASQLETARFLEMLANTGGSAALVGNGVWQGTRCGATIDAHDHVVRFNDFRLAGAGDALGRRVGIISSIRQNREALNQPNLANAEHGVVLGMPSIVHTRQTWSHVLPYWSGGLRSFLLPEHFRMGLQSTLHRFPSSGLNFAAMLARLWGGSQGISLFNMPLLSGSEGFSRHVGRPTSRHDWKSEAALARSLGFAFNGEGQDHRGPDLADSREAT